MTSDVGNRSPIHVQLLSADGCRYCHEARAVLARLGTEYPLAIEVLPVDSHRGRELALRHGVLFPPGIVIEGEFLQYGRPSERKLRARLAEVATRRGAGGRA